MRVMNISVFPNTGKEEVYLFFKELIPALKEEGFRFYLPESARPCFEERHIYLSEDYYQSYEWLGTHTTVGLSIGGDGSFLQAARDMAAYPILLAGIHMGELGFLNTISPANMKRRFQEIREGKYNVEKRVFLSSCIRHEDGTETSLPDVLNDIVIGHNMIGRMARLRLWIDDRFFQQYPADGLVISTPTGSTSYSLSCGGPIMDSRAENMIIVPICPHMIQNFSMVLPMDRTVKIQLPDREKQLHISLDGNGEYKICRNECLYIRCIHQKIRFIRFLDQDFFSTISSRLFPKIVAT
jgi:probable inorganic polyphosphate/ATP-NAD kinase